MKRYIYLLIGTLSMCVYGLMYTWTVFSMSVQLDLQVSSAAIANVFSICQIFFTFGGMISGFFYYKLPYRISMITTSLMMGLGVYFTSRVNSSFMIYFCYSFCYSLGSGFAYKSLLTAILTWFQDKPGTATGLLLMGAGLTAFIFNVPMSILINKLGWRNAMAILAIINLTLTMLSSLTVKPSNQLIVKKEVIDDKQINTKQMLKSNKFYLYFIWSILALAGCTALTGNAVNCGLSFGISTTVAATLSMIISLFNSTSRIFYGILYDKKGRKLTMGIATGFYVTCIALLFLAFILKSPIILSISFIFVGLTFGSIPTISNAYILETFGAKYYPSNFAIQQLYSLFSSFAGTMIFSIIFTKTNTYSTSYAFLIIYAIVTIILYISLNKQFERKGEKYDKLKISR